MAQQDEGWPLGLRPLNARLGLMRNLDFSAGSLSFNTLLTASPTSSTISSSDLDTQSTGSFFQDRSKTLGSLIGSSSIMEVSTRSTRRKISSEKLRDDKKSLKTKPWLLSLCSNLITDAVTEATSNNTPSLANFLEAERRRAAAANTNARSRRNQYDYFPDNYPTVSHSNSLFLNGLIAPQKSSAANNEIGSNSHDLLENGNGFGAAFLFPCLCGQLIK